VGLERSVRLADHEFRLPRLDRVRRSCTASQAPSRSGLLNLGPRIGKYYVVAEPDTFLPQHAPHVDGLILIFTGFLRLLRRAARYTHSTIFPGWLNIYYRRRRWGRSRAAVITLRLRGHALPAPGSRSRRIRLDLSRGLHAGFISFLRRADVYHPSLAVPPLQPPQGWWSSGVGGYIERTLRVDDSVGAVAVHASPASRHLLRGSLRRRFRPC